MNFPDKQKVTVAAPRRNNFDITQNYVGTMDFGRLIPTNWRMCRNGESYNVSPMTFLRCDPLIVPTFGRIRMITDSFFVPYHTVFANWENFKTLQSYTDENGTSHSVEQIPTFTSADLFAIFTQHSQFASETISTLQSSFDVSNLGSHLRDRDFIDEDGSSIEYDFIYSVILDTVGGDTHVVAVTTFKLTTLGKHIWNLLISLGYRLEYGFDHDDLDPVIPAGESVSVPVSTGSFEQSALPLLAFIKVYLDWYQANQFTMDSALRKLFTKIANTNYGTQIGHSELSSLLVSFNRCYSQDLYTASYLTPSGFSSGTFPSLYTDDDPDVSYIQQNFNGSESDVSIYSGKTILYLQRYQNYIDRWRVGGQRDIDRDLVEFGVKSNNVNYHRSRLLNSYSQELAISDVMSNSENSSTGLELGSYAGKGLSYGNSNFRFDTEDDGILLSISCIMPMTGYVHGTPKEMEDISLYDFYTPEFDSVGMEALGFGQLGNTGDTEFTHDINSVFGYVPRYAHLKVGHDTLAGDFRVGSLKTGLEAWHLFRENYMDELSNNEIFRQVHNTGVATPGIQTDNYDRIFNVTDQFEDHFYLFAQYKMSMESPMRSLTEQLIPYYDGDAHNEVSVENNGKQL